MHEQGHTHDTACYYPVTSFLDALHAQFKRDQAHMSIEHMSRSQRDAGAHAHHLADQAPSIWRVAPVMFAPASVHRNTVMSPMSRGLVNLPVGSFSFSRRAVASSLLHSRVSW